MINLFLTRLLCKKSFLIFLLFSCYQEVSLAGFYSGTTSGFSFPFNSSCTVNTSVISNIEVRITGLTTVRIKFDVQFNITGGTSEFTYEEEGQLISGNVTFPLSSNGHYCGSNIPANRTFWRAKLNGITLGSTNLTCSLVVSTEGFAPASSGSKSVNLSFSGIAPLLTGFAGITVACSGSMININASGGSPANVTVWARGVSIGTFLIDSNFDLGYRNVVSYTFPNLDNQNVTVELKNASGVVVDTKTIRVGTPLPDNMVITTSKPLPLCSAEPITLSINNPASSTVAWSNGSATINNPTNGVYSAIVQKQVNGLNVCPVVNKIINIQIFNFTPTISQPLQTTKCQGDAIDLTVNPGGSYSYEWKRDGQSAGSSQSIQANSAGSYSVSVKPTDNNCPAKVSNTIALKFDAPIEDKAILSSSPGNVICDAAIGIDLTAQPEGLTYDWKLDKGGFFNSAQKVKVTQAGRYSVNITRGACSRQKSIDIQDNNYDPDIAEAPAAFCSDTPITLTAKANDAARFDYAWKRSGASVGTNSPKLVLAPDLNTFTYSVEITAKGAGCPSKKSKELTIRADRAIKNPRLTPDPAIICNKAQGLTLTAMADSSAGIVFTWSGGGKNGTIPASYIVSNAGTYTATFTRGACSVSASVSPREEELSVSVTPPNSPSPILLCSGENSLPVELKAVSNLSSAVITWMRDGSPAPGNNSAATYFPTQTGQYYATASFNTCTATSALKITAEALTNFSVSITPASAVPICDDKTIVLTAAVSDTRYLAQYNYQWTQDSSIVKTGSGTTNGTFSTGKKIVYTGNSLKDGNEAGFIVRVKKDGCQASSPVNKITLKASRSGIIVLDFNTLQAGESTDKKYQWYYKTGIASSPDDSLGYQPLASATTQVLLGADMGSYIVRANHNECGTRFSLAYTVDRITAAEEPLQRQWKVYPNPASTAITVEHNMTASSSAAVTIRNTAGQLLISRTQTKTVENYSVEQFPAGIYILEITHKNQKISKKIVRQ